MSRLTLTATSFISGAFIAAVGYHYISSSISHDNLKITTAFNQEQQQHSETIKYKPKSNLNIVADWNRVVTKMSEVLGNY
jgi:hypothetical protein